jgi:hypothetical protein
MDDFIRMELTETTSKCLDKLVDSIVKKVETKKASPFELREMNVIISALIERGYNADRYKERQKTINRYYSELVSRGVHAS